MQINLVYSPQFDPDRFLKGERVSFYDPLINTFRGEDSVLPVGERNEFFTEDELYIRIQKNIKGIDLALYGYAGYWKSPRGFQSTGKQYIFNALNVFGASVEASLLGGVIAGELGYYNGEDDGGIDPFVPNDEFRWLINYSRDLKGNLNIGFQYYSEILLKYDEFRKAAAMFPIIPKKVNDMITFRVRKQVNKQRTELGLFTFYSIRNQDVYFRPNISHKLNDYWKISLGGNLFFGKDEFTPWNQFSNNTSVNIAIKWSI